MTEQPKTVVCTSCSAKFHVPDELVRGKLVKFRCRKCGEAIDVDGRRSARPPAAPPPTIEVTAVDTPATFSQRTLPPPRPPVTLSTTSPNLHPWPEPPRTRTTTAPTAISDSAPPEESLPRLETVRDPSNRGPKIAAIVALLIAAGLSGFGLAMRGSPGGQGNASAESSGDEPAVPADPKSAAGRAHAVAEAKVDDPSPANRSPKRITDLPPAIEGTEPAHAAAAAAKPPESLSDQQDPSHEAANAATGPAGPNGAAPMAATAPGAEDVPPLATGATDPGAIPPPSTVTSAAAPLAPAPAARAKGDFSTQAARETLEDAAGRAGKCRNIDTPSGTARVAVTFAPNGHVTNAVIESGPFVGTAAGNCVASKFRSAKVPPFSGESVLVRKSVPF
jgi:hypothetical protein